MQPNPTAARRRLAVLLSETRERHDRSLDELAQFLRRQRPAEERRTTLTVVIDEAALARGPVTARSGGRSSFISATPPIGRR